MRKSLTETKMSKLQDIIDLLQKEIESLNKIRTKLIEPILCNHPAISFEVYPNDLGEMSWADAKKACADLGDGWRLPNRIELLHMCNNQDKLGGFASSYYWSSTEFGFNLAWGQYFTNGLQYYSNKHSNYYVRAVRDVN